MSNCATSEDEVMDDEVTSELTFLAREVRKFPEILSKSQVPLAKAKKDQALQKLHEKYLRNFGKPYSIVKLQKKINNMKTRLKKKTDLKKTGNKPISLLPWERELYSAMDGDSNPTISKIPNATSSISSEPEETQARNIKDINDSPPKKQLKLMARAKLIPPSQRNTKPQLDLFESEETKNLSTAELQRLVLLEQLKTTREQRNYYELKKIMVIEKMNSDTMSFNPISKTSQFTEQSP